MLSNITIIAFANVIDHTNAIIMIMIRAMRRAHLRQLYNCLHIMPGPHRDHIVLSTSSTSSSLAASSQMNRSIVYMKKKSPTSKWPA